MYVRLAFAVAAHLEPEILLVDEVLAVGDAAFQRKCLGKMQDVGRAGRTVLFVSHNMPAVTRLCSRADAARDGRIVDDGPADHGRRAVPVVGARRVARRDWPDRDRRARATTASACGRSRWSTKRGTVIWSRVTYASRSGSKIVFEHHRAEVSVRSGDHPRRTIRGRPIFGAMDTDPAWRTARAPWDHTQRPRGFPANLLNEGTMIVSVALGTFSAGGRTIRQAHALDVVSFQVIDPGEGGRLAATIPARGRAPVRPLLAWTAAHAEIGTVHSHESGVALGSSPSRGCSATRRSACCGRAARWARACGCACP